LSRVASRPDGIAHVMQAIEEADQIEVALSVRTITIR
jgi:hypothetical protein